MARREMLRVRLDQAEIEALDELALLRGGLTRSELVRQLVREASPVPPPPPTIEELLAPFSDGPFSDSPSYHSRRSAPSEQSAGPAVESCSP